MHSAYLIFSSPPLHTLTQAFAQVHPPQLLHLSHTHCMVHGDIDHAITRYLYFTNRVSSVPEERKQIYRYVSTLQYADRDRRRRTTPSHATYGDRMATAYRLGPWPAAGRRGRSALLMLRRCLCRTRTRLVAGDMPTRSHPTRSSACVAYGDELDPYNIPRTAHPTRSVRPPVCFRVLPVCSGPHPALRVSGYNHTDGIRAGTGFATSTAMTVLPSPMMCRTTYTTPSNGLS